MRKILLFLVGILIILIGFTGYKYVKQRTVKNYLLVKVDFLGAPELFSKGVVSVKLYKEGKTREEIENLKGIKKRVFIIDSGEYLIKLNYDNKEIIRKIYKSDDEELVTSFTLEPTKTMKNVNNISRLLVFFSLTINILLFYKFIYKSKKVMNSYLYPLFFLMIIHNFLSFTTLFGSDTLKNFQLNTELLLFLFLGIYFFVLLNSKKNSIIIKILFGFFIIMALSLLAHTAIFSNLNSFSYFLSYYSVIKNIIYVFSIILNYSVFFIFAIIIFRKLKSIKNIILRKTLLYILLVLFSIFIISFAYSFFLPIFHVNTVQISVFFWLLFFESNVEAFLYIHKKYKNIFFYSFKIFILFQITYLCSMYMKNISIFIILVLTVIFLDVVYFFMISSVKNNNMFEDIFMKLKGVDDIEIFENIFEKEIMKNLPIESAKFKIFLNVEEMTKYSEKSKTDVVVSKENLKDEYKKFDFGIKLNTEKDACIALLLIETKNKNTEKEVIILLADLM